MKYHDKVESFTILSVTNFELITTIGKPVPGVVEAPT
jgi:hypothetical protein